MLRRVVAFTNNGPPTQVVRVVSLPRLPAPRPKTVNIRFRLSPVNPSDINVIEGVYPTKPIPRSDIADNGPGSSSEPCSIVGNEGLAEIAAVGEDVSHLKPGDKVVMLKQQSGTWSSSENVLETDVLKLPNSSQVNDVQAATITVNPPTAYNMLKGFVSQVVGPVLSHPPNFG